MSWSFYSREGKLLYGVVATASGNASTLDGIDSTGFVRIGVPGLNIGDVNISGRVTLPLVETVINLDLATGSYRTVLADTTSSSISITLPASPLVGEVYEIRDSGNSGAGNASVNNITVVRGDLGHAIDGVTADLVITENGKGVTLAFDGTNWITLSDRLNLASIDAATVDGLDSTQFLRSDVADTAFDSITFAEVTTFSKSTYSPVTLVSTDTTLDDTYRTVLVDPNGSPRTITLPTSPVSGQWYEFRDVGAGGGGDATANPISISGNGALINGSISDFLLDSDGHSAIVVSDGTDWFTLSIFDSAVTTPSLDDLADVSASTPSDGGILRYDSGVATWKDTSDVTVDAVGRVHINNNASSAGISLGDDAGVGEEVTITWSGSKTLSLTGRIKSNGTLNNSITYLQSGILPVAVDTYEVVLPTDNTIICNADSGDVFVRVPGLLNTLPPEDGDVLTLKDGTGAASVNNIAFLSEGVRRRNVPVMSLASVTGTISGAPTTSTPGGIGVDEQQAVLITGSGTFELVFDGATTAATLTEASTALDVENALNSLSPHPNYGAFSVSCTGIDVSTGAGVIVTFDGGTLIDGESTYYLSTPYESIKLIHYGGNWLSI